MAKDPTQWLASTVRVLLKRIAVLEDSMDKKVDVTNVVTALTTHHGLIMKMQKVDSDLLRDEFVDKRVEQVTGKKVEERLSNVVASIAGQHEIIAGQQTHVQKLSQGFEKLDAYVKANFQDVHKTLDEIIDLNVRENDEVNDSNLSENNSDGNTEDYAELMRETHELKIMETALAKTLANIRFKTYSYDASVEHVKWLREEESRQEGETLKETAAKTNKETKKQKQKLKKKARREKIECDEGIAFDDFRDYVEAGGTEDFEAFLVIRGG